MCRCNAAVYTLPFNQQRWWGTACCHNNNMFSAAHYICLLSFLLSLTFRSAVGSGSACRSPVTWWLLAHTAALRLLSGTNSTSLSNIIKNIIFCSHFMIHKASEFSLRAQPVLILSLNFLCAPTDVPFWFDLSDISQGAVIQKWFVPNDLDLVGSKGQSMSGIFLSGYSPLKYQNWIMDLVRQGLMSFCEMFPEPFHSLSPHGPPSAIRLFASNT